MRSANTICKTQCVKGNMFQPLDLWVPQISGVGEQWSMKNVNKRRLGDNEYRWND